MIFNPMRPPIKTVGGELYAMSDGEPADVILMLARLESRILELEDRVNALEKTNIAISQATDPGRPAIIHPLQTRLELDEA